MSDFISRIEALESAVRMLLTDHLSRVDVSDEKAVQRGREFYRKLIDLGARDALGELAEQAMTQLDVMVVEQSSRPCWQFLKRG